MKRSQVSHNLAAVGLSVLLWTVATPSSAQIATGTVAGTVKDAQGGSIPGATVTLISATQGTKIDGVTSQNGDFVLPNVPGDTYTIRVTMDGFKTLERSNVAVSPGSRDAVPTLTIEVGTLSETVTVAGEAPMIQSQTGERSFTVSSDAIQKLPVNSRNWSALTALTPGVLGSTRLGNVGQQNNNVMVDGVAIMDTGNNGTMLQTNADAIAEVRILTEGYQAEFGRASGMQITAITKSGTNQFRGTLYDFERNSNRNSNSWVNMKNGDPKAVSKQRDWGYTIGGPIGKPGGQNNLFFFYSHEYRPRTTGGEINKFRVPTALERAGDFSQTRDNTGNLFNLIRDASTGLPCTAANASGCFRDGGVPGRIPQDRLYPTGLNILKLWPMPNTEGLDYNYQYARPIDKRLTQQPTVRVDYQASNKLRITGKYTGQLGTVKALRSGATIIPGFNDMLQKYPFIYQPSATVDYTVGQSTFVEGTWGLIQNQLGSPIVSPAGNRCNVGLCDLPSLYPGAGTVDPRYYNYQVLKNIGVPFFVDGRIMLPPTFQWGNRIQNSANTNTPPNLIYPAFLNLNRTHNVSISATKLAGHHTLKAGFYSFLAYKAENLGITGAIPFNGLLNFGNDANNPLDSGFGYANAALGVFSSYSQQSRFVQGAFRYKNIEWYLQDNWKMSGGLTLDYGVRFTHQQPQHDSYLQASNFFPEKWTLSSAPLLYLPGCIGASPCSGANRVAVNPATGVSLGPSSAVAIGTIVSNSGNLTNGVIQAGKGIAKENYTWPKIAISPRFGAAYDLTGNQTFVFRGNFGMFVDRPEGNNTSNQIGNPPFSTTATVRYAQLQTLGTGGLATQSPAQLAIFLYDAKLPTSVQWSGGVQIALPWVSALDVSYVGEHRYNLLNQFNQPIDINAPDFGAAFLPQNQDPTQTPSATPGATALSTDLLRPFRGFGAINLQWPRFWTDYHSIQTSFNRRYRHGLQFGFNYTLGLSQTGTNTLNSTSGLRLQHNSDGSFVVRDDWKQAEKLLQDSGLRRHTVKGSFVWSLPGLHGAQSAAGRVVSQIVNDWQLSGVYTGGSGAPYDVSYAYQNGGSSNVNLTGSPGYAARIRIVGDPGRGCSSNQYAQFNAAAFAAPQAGGSLGLESGRNYLAGCPDNRWDFAIARDIRLGGGRQLEFRADVFNAFNAVIITARQTTLQLNSPIDPTVRNNQYNADGTVNTARLRPVDAGFGAAIGAEDLRSLQLQIRLRF